MIKAILSTATILFLWGTFNHATAQVKQVSANSPKADLKFLDDITVDMDPVHLNSGPAMPVSQPGRSGILAAAKKEAGTGSKEEIVSKAGIEKAHKLQFKYALLLDTEVELVQNMNLFKLIDEWFGTRYRLGGTTKAGVDCSALMQIFFTALYGVALPRTAREQYEACRKISPTELQEGDLVFFNTTGGVSHVGMYLQNNKFVHASSSGVTISDLFEDYWMKRLIGVGRIEEAQPRSETLISKL